ncbi:1,3-beta-glucanosyltransferase [Pseudohyphozyma bogoriensis]|nr:1,3-beta-glucanosyltransferase [Pseudohyphozyma bogoriensis]
MPRAAAKPPADALVVAPPSAELIALFRQEVKVLLEPPAAAKGHDVVVLSHFERLIPGADGKCHQDAVRLCSAGNTTWVDRLEGNRAYFPLSGRVSKSIAQGKRARDEIVEIVDEEEDKVERKKARASKGKAKKVVDDADSEIRTPKNTSAARKKYNTAPGAPPRASRRKDREGESDDMMRRRVREALDRGKDEVPEIVKQEPMEDVFGDDLASLCGRVNGLEVKSIVDAGLSHAVRGEEVGSSLVVPPPESEYGATPTPVAGPSGERRSSRLSIEA